MTRHTYMMAGNFMEQEHGDIVAYKSGTTICTVHTGVSSEDYHEVIRVIIEALDKRWPDE